MPRTFWQEWFWGPHDPKTRSLVGGFWWWVVHSTYWEYLFLSYILFNAVVKLTYQRIMPDEKAKFLLDVGFYASVIFNAEWLLEFLTFGYNEFFADNWYKSDTIVNVMNWGSYCRDIGVLSTPWSYFFPNIAFLRMLRFLKPLGRVKVLFPSKVVVKTVAAAMGSMGPVLALVGFAMFFFGIMGIYIFGAKGEMYYRCGVALELHDALKYYDPSGYAFDQGRDMQVQNCTIDMHRYHEFLKLRGSKVLGSPEGNLEDGNLTWSGSNFSETSAHFSPMKQPATSTSARRQPLQTWSQMFSAQGDPLTRRSMEVETRILDAETGTYKTKLTKIEIAKAEPDTEQCKTTPMSVDLGKREEIFIVDGRQMSAEEFVLSPEYKGRYEWLAQPMGGGEHRRRKPRSAERNEDDPQHSEDVSADHVGANHFKDVRCIVMQPPKICKCAIATVGFLTFSNSACIDPQCPTSLCFVTASPPISRLHGFSNIIQAALTITAIFFQKNWSIWMEKSAEVDPLMAAIFYFMTVILGSFCLLNLTVATVGQNYGRVKDEATTKKDIKAAEEARRAKIQAERDEMKKAAAKDDDDDDDDDDDEIEQLFETRTAYWYWLFGFFGLAFMHRFYFKLYNVDAPFGLTDKSIKTWYAPFRFSAFWFIVRCVTLNYFLVGWILDALRMNSLNDEASVAEKERIETWVETTNDTFKSEIDRLQHANVLHRASTGDATEKLRLTIGRFLLYPIDDPDDFPWSNSREYLEDEYQEFQEKNKEVLEALGLWEEEVEPVQAAGEDQSQADLEDDFSDLDDSEADDMEKPDESEAKQKPTQSHFAWFADFVVVANAMTLAMEGFDDSIQVYLDIVGYFASIFFIVEAIVKSFAHGGFTYYIKDGGNLYDFILVLLPSLGEGTTITTEFLGLGADYVYPALALQSLRVFRITKLTKHLTGLKRLTQQAFGSPLGVVYAMGVTIIFIVFCSMFGNELFRDSVVFAMRRNDFQYFLSAFQAMVEFLFGESYFENLELGYDIASVIGCFFFVGYFYIANYLVLRMFIALILENFEFDEDKRVSLQIQLFQKRQVDANDLIDGNAKPFGIDEQRKRLEKQNLDPDHLEKYEKQWIQVVKDRAAESGQATGAQHLWDVIIEAAERDGVRDEYGAGDEVSVFRKFLSKLNVKIREKVYDLIEWEVFNLFVASCIIFSVVLLQVDPPDAPILDPDVRSLIDRSLLAFFTTELFAKMYAFGTFKQPLPIRRTLTYPKGMPPFFSSSEEGGWNMIDFVFICISYVDLMGVSMGNFKTMRIVRVVRPLQKNIPTVKGLIAALLSSMGNIFHVFNLLILMMMIWGLIGVSLFRGRLHSCNDIAAANFMECVATSYGGMPSVPCDFMDPKFPNGTECENPIGFFLEQPILVPRVWEVPNENFENMAGGVMFLFRLLNADNLRPLFHSLMDVPASTQIICSGGGSGDAGCPPGESQYVVSDQPKTDSKPENILFAVVYIFFANAFISQLVIGVLIDNIRQQTGTALFTNAQRQWDSTGKTINSMLKLPPKPVRPTDVKIFGPIKLYAREFLYDILMSDLYDGIMMAIIIINTIWMATEHWPAEHWYHDLKNRIVDPAFVYIYLIETVAKIYSFGIIGWQEDDDPVVRPGDNVILKKLKIKNVKSPYFGDPWCLFDFCVVFLSVLMAFSSVADGLEPLKLLRVLRVFRLVKKIKTLQIMIATLLGALPSIASALFFLAIWIFLFGAIGMQFFSNLKNGEVINHAWNFHSITNSMVLLFRISTGDGWFPIIYDASIAPPFCTMKSEIPNTCDPSCDTNCDPSIAMIELPGDCGAGPIAYVYFFMFWFGCNFIFGPLFVATLIDYFFEAQINEDSLFNDEECAYYAQAWQEFDEHQTEKISIENLRPLIERLKDLGSRVGFRVGSEKERYKKIWARVMTNPANFSGELAIPEELQEELGIAVLDRKTILKAFPNNEKSKKIRNYLYSHTRVREKEEVEFKYCAKVLCIMQDQDRFKAPITSADLLNRGASLQQFMGFLGIEDGVKGRDGAEKTRWEALAVHNKLVKRLEEGGGRQKKKKAQSADVSQLSKIDRAIGYIRLELRPPPPLPGTGEEATPKPTGDKREALMEKVSKMQASFEEISNGIIEELLYGLDTDGNCRAGILDVLLDKIIDHQVMLFATQACNSIEKRFEVGKGNQYCKQKRYSQNVLELKAFEPVVSSVPRGWLNSHRKSKPKRLAFLPEIQDVVEDKTEKTLNLLTKLAPARPRRGDSMKQQMSKRGTGRQDARSEHYKNRVKSIEHNQVWRQMFEAQQLGANEIASKIGGGMPDLAFSWRDQYSTAMDSVTERLNQARSTFTPLSVSRPESFTPLNLPLNQLRLLGSMVGVCEAPSKTDDPEPDVPDASAP